MPSTASSAAREAYSAGRYAVDAASAIAEAREQRPGAHRRRRHRALLQGAAGRPLAGAGRSIPTCAPTGAPRRRERPAPELHAILAARDPEMAARLMPTDPQRIVRALEVLESTGRSLADWQREPGQPVLARGARRCGCWCCRIAHAQASAIDARFDAMLAAGALEEVRALRGSRPLRRSCRSCGRSGWRRWRPISPAALGLDEAVALAKAETRQYAKRQLTWLRRNMITWKSINTQEMERITADILSFIDS